MAIGDKKSAVMQSDIVNDFTTGGSTNVLSAEMGKTLAQRPNPNLLDGWYFGNPVDQRGGYVVLPNSPIYKGADTSLDPYTTDKYIKVDEYNDNNWCTVTIDGDSSYRVWSVYCVRGYTGAGYGIDRWITTGSGMVVLIENDGITVKNTGTETGYFSQVKEPMEVGYYAASLNVLSVSGAVDAILRNHDTWDYQGTLTISGVGVSGSVLTVKDAWKSYSQWFEIRLAAGASVKLKAVKLELGYQQTLAHQDENGNWILNEIPNYAEQLLRCSQSTADASDTYANGKTGFAPGGYGLGATGIRLNSWNDAKANGFYYSDGDAPTSAWWQGFCVVTNPTSCVVHAYQLSTGGITYECRREYTTELGWSPWEWSNPPMSIGIEYRTTERYRGKPVYVKVVDYGEVPTSGWKSVDHGISNIGSCISCFAELGPGGPGNQTGAITACYANQTKIWIQTTTHDAGHYAYVTLKYTKTTD